MKRILAFVLLAAVLLTACGKGAAPQETTAPVAETREILWGPDVVGVCLPNNTDKHWLELAAALEQTLSQAGLTAAVEYAGDDVTQQVSQVETLVRRQVGCLVVVAVDPVTLNDALQQAKQANIPVIAYDRLLMLTDAVTAYVGFDREQTGTEIANRIVADLKLDTALDEGRSYTIELFMGAGEDPNALQLYRGVRNRLLPYMESGALVCRTGRTAFEDVCVRDGDLAKLRCEAYLTEYYPEDLPNILVAGSDEIAGALWQTLEASGRLPEEGRPLITGLGATPAGVKQILAGQQLVTAWENRAEQIKRCITAVQTVLAQKSLSYLSTVCDNGVREIPAFFAATELVDGENYREILANSGIDTE